jgi:hypothetical protein
MLKETQAKNSVHRVHVMRERGQDETITFELPR